MRAIVENGVDRLREKAAFFKNKKVGLITNVTGVTKTFESTVTALDEVAIVSRLFAPEHGIRGEAQAGEKVSSYFDNYYQKEVISLYGSKRAPEAKELVDLDMLVYDLQDIGSRYYTYIYTMYLSLKACAKAGIPFVVLDRLDIFGGNQVLGVEMPEKYYSFVGMLPIPNVYGMTVGELARFCNEELKIQAELHVIEVVGWQRGQKISETDLPWIMPSPNIPTPQTAWIYTGTCLFEGTNLSEGRGTTRPFEIIGAPWLDSEDLAKKLNKIALPGTYFRSIHFTPTFSKYEGIPCDGVQIHVTDSKVFNPLVAAYKLLEIVNQDYAHELRIELPFEDSKHLFFTHLMGHEPEMSIDLDGKAEKFLERRQRYLLY